MAGDNVVQFADSTNMALHANPTGCLRAVLGDIEAGLFAPSHCMILLYSTNPDGTRKMHSYRAQLDRPEEIAMLELFKSMKILEWLGGN